MESFSTPKGGYLLGLAAFLDPEGRVLCCALEESVLDP
jgi:hypothetical protein